MLYYEETNLKTEADSMPRNILGEDLSNRVYKIQQAFKVYKNAYDIYAEYLLDRK